MVGMALACWASLSVEFSRQEYWSGLPFPAPGHLPDPGTKTSPLASLPLESPGSPSTSHSWNQISHVI